MILILTLGEVISAQFWILLKFMKSQANCSVQAITVRYFVENAFLLSLLLFL